MFWAENCIGRPDLLWLKVECERTDQIFTAIPMLCREGWAAVEEGEGPWELIAMKREHMKVTTEYTVNQEF